MYYFALVLMFLSKIQAEPFILNPVKTCESPMGKNLPLVKQTYSTSLDSYELFINPCEALPAGYCGHSAKVCIRNKLNTSLILAGNRFHKSGRDSMNVNISVSSLCKEGNVSVVFVCSYDLIKQPKFFKIGNCTFEIQLFDLRPTCNPSCTVRIDNNVINLMPLSKVYNGQSDAFNYSVGFCTLSNDKCRDGDEVTACVYMYKGNKKYKPLSQESAVQMKYNSDKNQIDVKGHYEGSKANDMSITLKCNWDKKVPELSSLPVSKKTFRFELESSYGCIKTPSSCVIDDNPMHVYNIYNFTSLSRTDYWSIPSPGGVILLNVCGRLALPNQEGCSGSAQVCEKNGQHFINRGRLQVLSKQSGEEPYMIFTDGDVCKKDSSKRYETKIMFMCSGTESGPKFNKTKDCLTTLTWSTPAACPKQDESKCSITPRQYQNCTFIEDDLLYNFSSLVRKYDGHIVKNVQDPNVEYRLNLCEPVIDPEVPCQKNSMAIKKYLDQHDITKKVVLLGGFWKFQVLSHNVSKIKTSGGTLNRDSWNYYESVISLECSAEEEGPKLEGESDNSTVYFQWKTPAACPKKIKTDQCIVGDHFSEKRFNLTSLKEKSLRINISNVSYIFDICDSYTSDCAREKSCEYVPVHNLITIAKKHYLEFNLSRGCNSNGDFNRTLIELTCGQITNNDHFVIKPVIDCVLKLELQSSLICSREEMFLNYNFSTPTVRSMTKTVLRTYKRNCLVVNNSTGYIFNIDKLKLNISSPKCPKFFFKRSSGVTELLFTTDVPCLETNVAQNWTFLVTLKCPTDTYQGVKATMCQNVVTREDLEFCKLLEVREETSHTSFILSIVVPVLIFVLCIGIFALYKSKKSKCVERPLLSSTYCKEADL